jgi:hypothetical protein
MENAFQATARDNINIGHTIALPWGPGWANEIRTKNKYTPAQGYRTPN